MIEADPSSLLTKKLGGIPTSGTTEAAPKSAYSVIPQWLFSWKTMLVFIIVGGIVWVLRPYFSMFKNITSMVSTVAGGMEESTETETEPELETETEDVDVELDKNKKKPKQVETPDKMAPMPESSADAKIKQKVNGRKKVTMPADEPKPDDSASVTQGGSQGGFCLAGEWKGVRTCVQVDSKTDCTSGQLFQTEDTCINPQLRA